LKSLIDILWLGAVSSSVDGLTPDATSSAANMSTLTSPLFYTFRSRDAGMFSIKQVRVCCCCSAIMAGLPREHMRYLPSTVLPPSRGHISETKQERPQLLWNTIRKLASLILLPHSEPLGRNSGFKYKILNMQKYEYGLLRQTTAVVNQARPSSTGG